MGTRGPLLVVLAGLAGLAGACSAGGDVPPALSTYARIKGAVFAESCAAASCHSSVAQAGNLRLDDDSAYDRLVGKPADNSMAAQMGLMRVAPGNADKSFLYMKVMGDLANGMGASMPKSGPKLDAKTVSVIRAWIAAGAPRDGIVPGDDGSPLNQGDCDPATPEEGCGAFVPPPPPVRGVQIHVTADAVPVGTEETSCHYLKLSSDVDLDVNRIQIAVSGGSHHVHIYRPFDRTYTVDDHSEVCNKAVDFTTWELVAAGQLPWVDWEMPPGVAYHFRAGEQLLVQTHFVNVGALSTTGEGQVYFNLHDAMPGTIEMHAGSIFGQDRDVDVPPYSTPTVSADCVFPKNITMLALTGHYHFRGRHFYVNRLDTLGTPGALIYDQEGYDDPLFTVYDAPAPAFAPGEGFRWSCSYVNDSANEYVFGPFTDTNEHCNLFAFYYPTADVDEAIYCVKKGGVSTTTVLGPRVGPQ